MLDLRVKKDQHPNIISDALSEEAEPKQFFDICRQSQKKTNCHYYNDHKLIIVDSLGLTLPLV